MFKDFYHLKSEPFGTHPDLDFNFVSNTHKEAWYYLLVGVKSQEPFMVLTGEYGMGKTLLCLRLFQTLAEQESFPVEYIPTPYEEYIGILKRIAFRLGISAKIEDEGILQDNIYDVFRTGTKNSRFCLIIDDAHELSTTTLTKLKQFSTFSHNGFFPIMMVFFAHPSFLKELSNPALISLNQRIKRRYQLSRFNFEETTEYIYYRLLKSGASGFPAFSEEALEKIFLYSRGIPRMINNICDTCMLIGASKECTTILPDVVDVAVRMIEGNLEGAEAKADAKDLSGNSADSKDAERAFIAISEDVTQGISHHHGRDSGNKKRKFLLFAMSVSLVLLSVFVFYRIFMNDSLISNLSNLPILGMNRTKPPDISPLPLPETVKDQPSPQDIKPQIEKETDRVPILREELDNKHSSETSDASSQPISGSQEPVITPLQVGSAADIPSDVPSGAGSSPSHVDGQFYPYSIRYSSYRHPNQAAAAIAEITKLGLSPYVVRVDSGDANIWWRLYIGLYATKQEARSVIKTYNLRDAAVLTTHYACRISEFTNETDLMNMFQQLKMSGYFPYTFQKSEGRYFLYLGAYEKKIEAENLCRKLQNTGISCQVVKR